MLRIVQHDQWGGNWKVLSSGLGEIQAQLTDKLLSKKVMHTKDWIRKFPCDYFIPMCTFILHCDLHDVSPQNVEYEDFSCFPLLPEWYYFREALNALTFSPWELRFSEVSCLCSRFPCTLLADRVATAVLTNVWVLWRGQYLFDWTKFGGFWYKQILHRHVLIFVYYFTVCYILSLMWSLLKTFLVVWGVYSSMVSTKSGLIFNLIIVK